MNSQTPFGGRLQEHHQCSVDQVKPESETDYFHKHRIVYYLYEAEDYSVISGIPSIPQKSYHFYILDDNKVG